MEVLLSISNSNKAKSLTFFMKPLPPTFPISVKYTTYLSMIMLEAWESSLNQTPPSLTNQSILSSIGLIPQYLLLCTCLLQSHSHHYYPPRSLDTSLFFPDPIMPFLQSFLSTVGLEESRLPTYQGALNIYADTYKPHTLVIMIQWFGVRFKYPCY